MNNCQCKKTEKIIKEIEKKVIDGTIKTKEELKENLSEQQYRGILTKMQVNTLFKELSKSYNDELEIKVKNGDLKSKEELKTHLLELQYRGILTKMQADLIFEELSKLYENKEATKKNNKRVTRTPQKHYFN